MGEEREGERCWGSCGESGELCGFFTKFVAMKEKLLGMTLEELKQAAVSCGLKGFVGAQLADWLYAKRATSWDRMVNISKSAKEALAEKYDLGISAPVGSSISTDGTKKYLFEVHPSEKNRTFPTEITEKIPARNQQGNSLVETGKHGEITGNPPAEITKKMQAYNQQVSGLVVEGGMAALNKKDGCRIMDGVEVHPAGKAGTNSGGIIEEGPAVKGEGREFVEAVMIPEEERRTLCVSSQAGCKMGCKFCMTGRHGFHGQLEAADILNQFLSIDEAAELTNTVFMGMGEPLDNYAAVSRAIEVLTAPWGFAWSPKRVTVSTIGVLPTLKRYLDEQRCHLAVSLHNPFPEERLQMMPAQKAWDIREVLDLIRQYDFSGQRRVSFEYTMFKGFNDDKRHADALIRLLRGLECRVNLIRFHKIPDFPYDCATDAAMEAFRDRLNNHQVLCTIRSSRGEDILAACGMLAGQHTSSD